VEYLFSVFFLISCFFLVELGRICLTERPQLIYFSKGAPEVFGLFSLTSSQDAGVVSLVAFFGKGLFNISD